MSFVLNDDGLQLHRDLLADDELMALEPLLPDGSDAGIRIFDNPTLDDWLDRGPIGQKVRGFARAKMRPVRAILFDKTTDANWSLGWHQDRTIALRTRIDTPGFDRWTIKSGVDHAEPPFSIIENMITARIHLDPVNDSNSPLLVAPGSHRMGRIQEPDIAVAIEQSGTFACLASRGDVWFYRSAILHASARSTVNARRRVLQVDYSSDELTSGLEWLGIG